MGWGSAAHVTPASFLHNFFSASPFSFSLLFFAPFSIRALFYPFYWGRLMLRRPTLSLSLRTYAKPLLLLLLLLHICTVPVYMCGNALRCALNQPLHREKAQIYTRRRHVDYYMTFAYCTCRLIPSSLLLLHLLLLPSDSCIDYAVPFADGRRLLHHPIPCVVPRIRDFKLCCCCYLRCLSVWECLLRRNERELS